MVGYQPQKIKKDQDSKVKLNSTIKTPFLELGCLDFVEGGEIKVEQKIKSKSRDVASTT